ncbi:rRNA pseudouridine synthase [Halobacillus halophilus]|uniref:Pseudouridine synthase n=1 Tax=Halobacillus halophilus (strain ATCC 35676 / DSM 2266 / JCM 20832 / KCTC 3685 / LMG 17431 / NBRC 102448 / NCIMB 2269) TaxID=866895 RepID=I0JNF8_HALH3|nr:pseudouridine synthase [Halobacillus halophilus]ASF41494.1 rRNA pseudouridine synthase [Halobacillus halophilus]CCG45678.1 23S rRNA pseudouridine synthase [Halobacillus halophilus DSM 2266]
MERLQKVIAHAGVASRRKAEQMIIDGKVKVNGEVVKELGTKVSSNDDVEVEGVPIVKEAPVYYLLYKPRGVISSVSDDKGRKVVTDYLPEVDERIFPIGRLDYDTSGLLLLTNDGEFANLLMHPKHEVDKVYIAKTKGIPTREQLQQLKKGINIDGEYLKAVHAKINSSDPKKNSAIIQVILHEGKNRQVRRMFEALGYPVDKLKRERYGTLDLRGMNAGDSRPLKPHEVKQLRQLAEKNVE